jgi:hypothetical protein
MKRKVKSERLAVPQTMMELQDRKVCFQKLLELEATMDRVKGTKLIFLVGICKSNFQSGGN